MIIKNLKKYFTFEVQVNMIQMSCWDLWAKIVRNSVGWEKIRSLRYFLTTSSFVDTSGPGRQERKEAISRVKLSVDHTSKTFHLHDANETWRRMESNSGKLHLNFCLDTSVASVLQIKRTSYQIDIDWSLVVWCTSLKAYIGFDLFSKYSFLWSVIIFKEKTKSRFCC